MDGTIEKFTSSEHNYQNYSVKIIDGNTDMTGMTEYTKHVIII